jgi:hypothetical protein
MNRDSAANHPFSQVVVLIFRHKKISASFQSPRCNSKKLAQRAKTINKALHVDAGSEQGGEKGGSDKAEHHR